jgi:hypothetical protein
MDDEPPPMTGDEPPDTKPYPNGFFDSLVRVSTSEEVYFTFHRNGYGDNLTRKLLFDIFGPGELHLMRDTWLYRPERI